MPSLKSRKIGLRSSVALTLLLLLSRPLYSGEILDRIVATVNGQIILLSDWQDAARYEAFISQRPVGDLTVADRKAVLDRLIDQELLREQMSAIDSPHCTPESVNARLADIRKQYVEVKTQSDWENLLHQYELTEEQLKHHVENELNVLLLVDARLRPSVSVDAQSIESYYNQEILPQLRQSGSAEKPLAQLTPKIKEVLTQQKMNELLTAWLQNLRAGSDIRTSENAPQAQ